MFGEPANNSSPIKEEQTMFDMDMGDMGDGIPLAAPVQSRPTIPRLPLKGLNPTLDTSLPSAGSVGSSTDFMPTGVNTQYARSAPGSTTGTPRNNVGAGTFMSSSYDQASQASHMARAAAASAHHLPFVSPISAMLRQTTTNTQQSDFKPINMPPPRTPMAAIHPQPPVSAIPPQQQQQHLSSSVPNSFGSPLVSTTRLPGAVFMPSGDPASVFQLSPMDNEPWSFEEISGAMELLTRNRPSGPRTPRRGSDLLDIPTSGRPRSSSLPSTPSNHPGSASNPVTVPAVRRRISKQHHQHQHLSTSAGAAGTSPLSSTPPRASHSPRVITPGSRAGAASTAAAVAAAAQGTVAPTPWAGGPIYASSAGAVFNLYHPTRLTPIERAKQTRLIGPLDHKSGVYDRLLRREEAVNPAVLHNSIPWDPTTKEVPVDTLAVVPQKSLEHSAFCLRLHKNECSNQYTTAGRVPGRNVTRIATFEVCYTDQDGKQHRCSEPRTTTLLLQNGRDSVVHSYFSLGTKQNPELLGYLKTIKTWSEEKRSSGHAHHHTTDVTLFDIATPELSLPGSHGVTLFEARTAHPQRNAEGSPSTSSTEADQLDLPTGTAMEGIIHTPRT